MVHGSIAIPGKTDRDEVVITTEEIAASGLDYLALGHWHSVQEGKAGGVTYAYPGAPEAVAVDQDRAGKVLLVTLDETPAGRTVRIDQEQVGKTRFERVQVDAATILSQPVLIASLAKRGDPDLVLDARIVGVRPDELDLDIDEVETTLAAAFLKVRIRDVSMPPLTDGVLPSPDTVAGSFIRDLEAGSPTSKRPTARTRPPSAATRSGSGACCWRATRCRCEDPQIQLRDFRRYRDLDLDLGAGLTIVRGPNEAGKSTIQRAIELALTRRVTSAAGDLTRSGRGTSPTSVRRS